MWRLLLRSQSRTDLGHIWDYSAEQWGRARADDYAGRLVAKMNDLRLTGPGASRCDPIYPGLRRAKAGSHLIYFLLAEDGIDVVRILHERLDVSAHFDSDD